MNKIKTITRPTALSELADQACYTAFYLSSHGDTEGLKSYIKPFIASYYSRIFNTDAALERLYDELLGEKVSIVESSIRVA